MAIVIGLVAMIISVITAYKTFFQEAKVSIFTGDTMDIVRDWGQRPRRIHIRGVLSNAGPRMGTLQRLEAKIKAPNGDIQRYVWNLFFEGQPGTVNVQPVGLPVPISIQGKGSQPLMVEMKLHEPNVDSNWEEGSHHVTLEGWVNQKNRHQGPNVSHEFHVNISSQQASFLPIPLPQPGTSTYETIRIEEWND